MKFCFGAGLRKAAHSAKANHYCFDELGTCANGPIRMISFQVVFA